jgi:hypothetical protein
MWQSNGHVPMNPFAQHFDEPHPAPPYFATGSSVAMETMADKKLRSSLQSAII